MRLPAAKARPARRLPCPARHNTGTTGPHKKTRRRVLCASLNGVSIPATDFAVACAVSRNQLQPINHQSTQTRPTAHNTSSRVAISVRAGDVCLGWGHTQGGEPDKVGVPVNQRKPALRRALIQPTGWANHYSPGSVVASFFIEGTELLSICS